MTRNEPDPKYPFWVQAFYAEDGEDEELGVKWKAGDFAFETVHRDEFIAKIELAVLEEDPRFGHVESGRNPDIAYYKGPVQAMYGDRVPRTPCTEEPTKPCIDLGRATDATYRTTSCYPGPCNRYHV